MRYRLFHWIVCKNLLSHTVMKGYTGSADGTCIGLGMKTPVFRIIVFMLALGTHGKIPHGCFGAIIGDIINNGISRAAVGAIDKRIAKTAIHWIEQLPSAVVTNRHVR